MSYKFIKNIGLPIIFLIIIFLLNPYSLAIPAGYLMIVVIVIFRGQKLFFCLDNNFLVLLAFSISYSIFNYFGDHKGIQYLIIQATFPYFFYALGKILIYPKISNKSVFYIIIAIGIIYSVSAILSIMVNLKQGGFAQTSRMIPSFWNGDEIKSTGMAGFLIYNAVIPALLIAYRKKLSLFLIVLMGTFYIITLICGFRLGSRTLLAVAGLSFIFSLFLVLREQTLKDNIKLIISLTIILGTVLIFFPINLDSPIFSTLGYRLQSTGASNNLGSAGGRTELWADGLDKLLTNPLGWTSQRYHHNLWLDTAKVAGIIPLFFLLLNNISCLYNVKKIFSYSNDQIHLGLKITFSLYFLATFLLFFTEPVIEGNFFSFVVYCLLFGIMKGFLETKKK